MAHTARMGEGKLIQFLVGKREGYWSLERRRHKWEDDSDKGPIYGHHFIGQTVQSFRLIYIKTVRNSSCNERVYWM